MLVSTNKLAASGSLTVSANGADAAGGALTSISSGGGGAGSVYLAIRDSSASIAGSLSLQAQGGAGGTNNPSSALGGGGGGGGAVSALICDRGATNTASVPIAIPAANVTSSVTGGLGWVIGISNGHGQSGQANVADGTNSGYSWACGYDK